MLDFEELRTIVALADHGSFQVAAAHLQSSRSRLRRKLAALEERTGVELMVRVDGVLEPTRACEDLVKGARRLLDEGARLIAHTRELAREPSGRLRLALPVGFPHHLFCMARRLMFARFPRVSLELRVAERPTDLLPDEAEMAMYISDREIEVPACQQLKVVDVGCRLVGSEAYFRRHGRPESPEALTDHVVYLWRPPQGTVHHLPLHDGGRLVIDSELISSDERLLRRMALAGDGLAFVPDPGLPDPEFAGLELVLGETVGKDLQVRMCMPLVLGDLPRVREVARVLRELDIPSR